MIPRLYISVSCMEISLIAITFQRTSISVKVSIDERESPWHGNRIQNCGCYRDIARIPLLCNTLLNDSQSQYNAIRIESFLLFAPNLFDKQHLFCLLFRFTLFRDNNNNISFVICSSKFEF